VTCDELAYPPRNIPGNPGSRQGERDTMTRLVAPLWRDLTRCVKEGAGDQLLSSMLLHFNLPHSLCVFRARIREI
jgi:hypothetical protein